MHFPYGSSMNIQVTKSMGKKFWTTPFPMDFSFPYSVELSKIQCFPNGKAGPRIITPTNLFILLFAVIHNFKHII